MENYSAGCDFRKSSDDTNSNDNGHTDNEGDDDGDHDNKNTDIYSRFQPGIVAPPSDETESRLYRIF